ncbi:glucose 1-dehydrogenase [Hydrogenophaga sp.]|uniref:SDR family NAD(P)-dependent oxidoreductase n=1 Tax=Hydrogenophaga sp. TaxID=1904254 RepID=UPI00286E3141|nr:glucose 1-dehydrogenase [Hydrogenophaga sp.]
MSGKLQGKVALVTGAAQGIGRAIAERFVAEGAIVGMLDLKPERAEAAAAEVRAQIAGARVEAFAGNVADRATIANAVAALDARHGRLDVLVSNAIWVRYTPIADITPEMLQRMTATGFDSVVWGIQCAAPVMARNGGGSIVNIASAAAFLGMPNAMVYAGIKAGVLGLTRASAVELGAQRVRVNAVCPGSIQTEGVRINVDPAMAAQRLARTPLGRLGEVDDVASATLYLASDDSAWVTGESLLVDGGATRAVL